MLKELRDGRLDRGEGIVNKLREQGKMIEWSRVQEIAGDASVGRPHIAQALVEAGYVKKVADAFDTLIGRNGTAYVERREDDAGGRGAVHPRSAAASPAGRTRPTWASPTSRSSRSSRG